MVSIPLLVVWVTSQVLYLRVPILTALVLSMVLSLVCAAIASKIWERRSSNAEISFSELMIWSWYRLQKAERRLEKGLRASERIASHEEQLQVLHELTAALESKDPYTRGHSKRVERHSFKTGVAIGLPLVEVEMLRMSASLHDVGKIRVPNKVLHKTGKLSAEERSLIEQHPVLGAEMVASIGNEEIVDAVRHHHERWDGGGYPDGRAGTETPLFARVIAVADSYDAIRSTRSYRTGASRDEAVQILTDESGHQFDPDVVDAFLTTLPARGRAVAWFTSLATGPGTLWRLLKHLFQRFGSNALAPVLGAAGTAAIVGTTSLLSPAVPAEGYSLHVAQRATPTPATLAATAPGKESQSNDDGPVAARERTAAERRAARRQERRSSRRQERADSRAQAKDSGSTAPPAPSAQPDRPSTSPPTPPPAGTGANDQAGTGDPNDRGKDCDKGAREPSNGQQRHCG
jgi:putative nucleotidyltransferase with HDIG domain